MSNVLIAGFKNGFRIPFTGERIFKSYRNLPSAILNPNLVQQKIDTEISAGRVAGPFSKLPHNDLYSSPLGLVPQKAPNETNPPSVLPQRIFYKRWHTSGTLFSSIPNHRFCYSFNQTVWGGNINGKN